MEKEEILYNFFKGSLGEAHGRTVRLNWGTLNMPRAELQHLDELFTKEELKAAVFGMPGEKAPGPDGFTACFFKTCWTFIKDDLLAAFNCFHSLHTHIWKLLNTANMVLLPKKERSETASDYRHVSLMHSISKILCKLLANRLAPELDKLISRNQSAFIKKRSIQDNFLYVKNVIRDAHCKNSPTAFLKLDLAKAFDSVEWPFLLEVLEQMGFGQRWRDMLSILLASSSSRVLLNGKQGRLFRHRRGLRQGDPLSPMLFILVMEPLQRMFLMATEQGVLSPLERNTARMRASFYADDAAIFIKPEAADVQAVKAILKLFGDASGLRTNLQKCVAFFVGCEGMDTSNVLTDFGGSQGTFPCKYLGLPLGLRKPSRAELQIVLDKIVSKLRTWKGKLMDRAARLIFVNSVITSIAVYHLTAFPVDKWFIRKIDKLRRSFLWNAEEETTGGKCLVNWK
jgi:mannosylglycoprotein endo-beta-mannosidase